MTKDNVKKMLPYAAGLPIITSALFLICYEGTSMFVFLQSLLVVVLGYVAAVYDLRTNRVPNILILVMLGAWVIIVFSYLLWDLSAAVFLIRDAMFGFFTGGLLFMLIYIVSRRGLGGGDVKFIAVAGLNIGFSGVIGAVFYGSVLAGVTALILLLLRKIGRKDSMPLIPFLYIGILLAVFYR